MSFYSEKFDIDIRYWILLSEHQIDKFYELYSNKNRELINLIYGKNYYENWMICNDETFFDYMLDNMNKSKEDLISDFIDHYNISKTTLNDFIGYGEYKLTTYYQMLEEMYLTHFNNLHTTT